MEYNFRDLEQKWQQLWRERGTYAVSEHSEKPKFYVLDMFPYPSGAGLHVGHPLGYIASDILARFKRMQGFNVLHPMGFDAFGLPAEQYAIETGRHPAQTTEENIARYREQLDAIGFSYDWSREVRTSDPNYYKWTQWIFLRLFHSWYDRKAGKARPVSELVSIFDKEGNKSHPSPTDRALSFDRDEWRAQDEVTKRATLMQYRLAYQAHTDVWWCEALGTVLAADEVVAGVSERGGFPVERRKARQWSLRITEYAERLLEGLEGLDWSEGLKESQRQWIGKSHGAEVYFAHEESNRQIRVFTTRPDTLFGVDFLVLAPEHETVGVLTTDDRRDAVVEYQQSTASRSERDRMAETREVTGCFTGAYAVHPFSRKSIPIYIAEYVLAGYGTGAIMGVPSGDDRDHAFAKAMSLPITNIFGPRYTGEGACVGSDCVLENSDFLNGLTPAKAAGVMLRALDDADVGEARVAYKIRDAGFSRQRYWGEPFPVVYAGDTPFGIDEAELSAPDALRTLPVELPAVESYGPGPDGAGPLANVTDWVETPAGRRETDTMPGYAGSSWYFLRFMDPHNEAEFASRSATDYWRQVDVYVGGTEHAVGHLLYSRMWTKVLYDLGLIGFDEPFKRLINQGMISAFSFFGEGTFYKMQGNLTETKTTKNKQIVRSKNRPEEEVPTTLSVDGVEWHKASSWPFRFMGIADYLDKDNKLSQKKYSEYLANPKNSWLFQTDLPTIFWDEDGEEKSIQLWAEVEKMSKSKYNVVNPDDIVAKYGADTFRLYEMFLGPIEASKPWDTKGIEGVHRFLRKLWRLYFDDAGAWRVIEDDPGDAELRFIHRTIKKVGDDIERFSFNTAVSALMICVNELSALHCRKRTVLEALAVIICPFAPHLSEELWARFGHESSAVDAPWPAADSRYLADDTKLYPVAINGKTRTEMEFPLSAEQKDIERAVLADATVQKWTEGKTPKKVVFVKGKMVNVVV